MSRAPTLGMMLILALSAAGCSKEEEPVPPPAGPDAEAETALGSEPDSYSAVIARTFEVAGTTRTQKLLIARDGLRSRQEWEDAGRRFALIERPDLDRVFVVDLAANTYTERPLAEPPSPEGALDGEQVERIMPAYSGGTVTATERVGEETLEGRRCIVYKTRIESVLGGVSESKVWEAVDLNGLIVRSELTAPDGKTTTVLESVVTPADAALFELPLGAARQD